MLSACAMTWHAISWWSERTRLWDVGAATEFCSIAELTLVVFACQRVPTQGPLLSFHAMSARRG